MTFSIGNQLLTYLHFLAVVTSTANKNERDIMYDRLSRLKSCHPLDKCLEGMPPYRFKSPILMTAEEFQNSNCFCDEECDKFNDCCLGANIKKKTTVRMANYDCEVLPENTDAIYMITRCLEGTSYHSLKEKCELRPNRNKSDVLRIVPAFSVRSESVYRNVFCALCNNEDAYDLDIWKVIMNCSNNFTALGVKDILNFLNISEYNPVTSTWKYQNIICYLIIKIPLHRSHQVRLCKPHISECPLSGRYTNDDNYCRNFTAYLYEKDDEGKLINMYKNAFCARCHQINLKRLECESKVIYKKYRDFIEPFSYSLLMDINLEGGNIVGLTETCPQHYMYNPFSNRCEFIYCGLGYYYEIGKCIPKSFSLPENTLKNFQQESLNSTCKKIILNIEDFILFQNYTLYINRSNKLYLPFEYEKYGQTFAICNPVESNLFFKFNEIQSYLTLACLCVSLIAIILFLTIYFVLPKLRNLPGKNLISLAFAIFISQLLLLVGIDKTEIMSLCKILAVLIHFAFLATFFWMNILSLDIYRTFSSQQQIAKEDKNKTFIIYSCYAWISPAIIVAIAVTIDFLYPFNNYSPHYGLHICWIGGRKALLIFFAVPLALLLLLNIIFFIITTRSIRLTTKETKFAIKRKSDKVRFVLYFKLITIMGFSWIFGFVANLTEITFFWYLFIIFNALQGLFIFLAFTCKRKIFKSLKHTLLTKCRKKSKSIDSPKESFDSRKLSSSSNLNTLSTIMEIKLPNNLDK